MFISRAEWNEIRKEIIILKSEISGNEKKIELLFDLLKEQSKANSVVKAILDHLNLKLQETPAKVELVAKDDK